jgi:hypothetical protein
VQRAEALLANPALLSTVNRSLDAQLYREDANRLFIFLAAVGAVLKTTMIRIRGENAAGKKMLYYWLRSLRTRRASGTTRIHGPGGRAYEHEESIEVGLSHNYSI